MFDIFVVFNFYFSLCFFNLCVDFISSFLISFLNFQYFLHVYVRCIYWIRYVYFFHFWFEVFYTFDGYYFTKMYTKVCIHWYIFFKPLEFFIHLYIFPSYIYIFFPNSLFFKFLTLFFHITQWFHTD